MFDEDETESFLIVQKREDKNPVSKQDGRLLRSDVILSTDFKPNVRDYFRGHSTNYDEVDLNNREQQIDDDINIVGD